MVAGFALVYGTRPSNKTATPSASNPTPSTSTTSGQTLDLSNKGLKEISKSVLKNSQVTSLNVSNNNLTGALPGEIRFLTNLEVLDASNNTLTGVPAEIGQLSKLKTINFSNNKQNDVGKIQSQIPSVQILL
jgi:Leucine-rich repeat (LRR) protein